VYDWDLADPALNAISHLRQACEVLGKYTSLELELFQTSVIQLDILMILNASKASMTPSEIASLVFRELHSVSGLLTRMEKAGYIKKSRSREDQRRISVTIQPKGRDLLQRIQESGFARGAGILKSALSDGELSEFDRLLRLVRDASLREIALSSTPLPSTVNARAMVHRRT